MQLRVIGLPLAQVAQEEEHAPTETTTETEEHGAEEHNPILPAIGELIPGAIAFLIVFLVLQRFAFPRITQGMRERREKIQGDLEGAERARSEAESSLQRYEQQLQDARAESGRIMEEARRTAEEMRRDLLAKAEEESAQVVARAQEEVRAERDRAVQALRRELAEASVDLAERVVGESLDRERQLRLVDQYIDDVGNMRASGNGGGNGPGGSGTRPEGG